MRVFQLLVPLLFAAASPGSSQEYRGLKVGELRNNAHGIGGEVMLVDENTIFIRDFTYDGTGPDAFFYVGVDSEVPSDSGTLIPYPNDGGDRNRVLKKFDRSDVILRLPDGMKTSDIRWLSVWCRRFAVDFGNLIFPIGVEPPKPITIGAFSRLAHKVESGPIVAIDIKSFLIPNFYYDGAGPDAFFWVGKGSKPSPQGTKVPNEQGSLAVLGSYSGKDIIITLPGEMTIADIDWLSVWCVHYAHNFGSVVFPDNLVNLPPYIPALRDNAAEDNEQLSNCRAFMDGKLQARWGSDSVNAYVQLSAALEDNQWFAFGVSGDASRAKMIGADVVVAYYDSDADNYGVKDYYLSQKSQCSGGSGVCSDLSVGGANNAEVVTGDRRNGITTIQFKRPLNTGDQELDSVIPSNGDVRVIVAIGGLNSRKEANYHDGGWDSGVVDFGAANEDRCGGFSTDEPVVDVVNVQPWKKRIIAEQNSFEARIGPTGGKRGYSAVTGGPSWGIAWWINGQLIPELYVERGQTYTFSVEGGDSTANPAEYHPLYITDDVEGGYFSKNKTARGRERVMAGVKLDQSGEPSPTAAGRFCEYEHKTGDQSDKVASFAEFTDTLELKCRPGEPAKLTWTVPKDAPDLLYYQCYTHRNMGWKIHVLNPGQSSGIEGQDKGHAVGVAATASLLLAALTALLIVV